MIPQGPNARPAVVSPALPTGAAMDGPHEMNRVAKLPAVCPILTAARGIRGGPGQVSGAVARGMVVCDVCPSLLCVHRGR